VRKQIGSPQDRKKALIKRSLKNFHITTVAHGVRDQRNWIPQSPQREKVGVEVKKKIPPLKYKDIHSLTCS